MLNILTQALTRAGSKETLHNMTGIPIPTLYRWSTKGLPLSADYMSRLLAYAKTGKKHVPPEARDIVPIGNLSPEQTNQEA